LKEIDQVLIKRPRKLCEISSEPPKTVSERFSQH